MSIGFFNSAVLMSDAIFDGSEVAGLGDIQAELDCRQADED